MGPFSVIKLQSAAKRIEYGVGDAAQVATLEPGVVLRADTCELGHLRAAEAGYPPEAVGSQVGLLRADLGSPGNQELAHLVGVVHVLDVRPNAALLGATTRTPHGRDSHAQQWSGWMKRCRTVSR